jgi:DNA-binding MarR family transcriptional regulator
MKTAHPDRQPEPVKLPMLAAAPLAIELRHLRYFVALADTGNFTRAAERMFITQPTLSQQIRRLEEIVGAPLLQRRRDGVRLTKAGAALLDASCTVLSLVDLGVNRTRQAAGLGRQRLRVVVPPGLPRIRAVLLGFIELAAERERPRGCLAVNSVGELLPGDKEVTRSLADLLPVVEDGFLQGLRAAEQQARSRAAWICRAGRRR